MNTNQTIEFTTRSGNDAMIVENPKNGEKVDLMPFFNYMESWKDWYSEEVAQPTLVANVVADIMEHQNDLLTEVSEAAKEGVIFSNDVFMNYTLALQNASNLVRVFKKMTVKGKERYLAPKNADEIIKQFTISPPMPTNIGTIKNPINGKLLKTEPLFNFLNRDGEETADVIEHTASELEKRNPDSDLTMTTDLLRELANCIREMAA